LPCITSLGGRNSGIWDPELQIRIYKQIQAQNLRRNSAPTRSEEYPSSIGAGQFVNTVLSTISEISEKNCHIAKIRSSLIVKDIPHSFIK
jgi:hypothetical protein